MAQSNGTISRRFGLTLIHSLKIVLPALLLVSTSEAYSQQQGSGQDADEQRALTFDEWTEDLLSYADQMRETHVDLFFSMSEAQFESALSDLQKRLPELERHELVVELARITSMVNDGHTMLWLTPNDENRFHQVPILLYWLENGLYVLGVEKDHSAAVGGKVVRIGEKNVSEAMALVAPLVPRDNQMTVMSISPRYLEIPEVLHALGITRSMTDVTYVVETSAGEQISVKLDAIPDPWLSNLGNRPFIVPSDGDRIEMVYGRGSADKANPMYMSDPGNLFWYKWLDDSGTLYVQLNGILNKDDERMEEFFERVFHEADTRPIEKFVLDLRFNGGGNNFNNYPVIRGIVKRDHIDQDGKLFVITSRHTFSAASHLVTYLERNTEALFVGEPTGASPNHYGDARWVELPNSGLRARASTIYWQNSLPIPFESRDWTPPDLYTPLSIDDYLTGRDPALEAILSYEAEAPITDQLVEAFDSGLMDSVRPLFETYLSNPIHEFIDVEGPMNSLGYDLLSKDEFDSAVIVFELNAESYPESANVFDSLGDGYRATGNRDAAIAAYRKALEIDPGFSASANNLARLLEE